MNINGFREKWGVYGPEVLIYQFISDAPEFDGDSALAAKIGELVSDLRHVLSQLPEEEERVCEHKFRDYGSIGWVCRDCGTKAPEGYMTTL